MVGGDRGKTLRYGEVSHSNGGFNGVLGTAQHGTVTLWRSISANSTAELYADGTSAANGTNVNYFAIPASTFVTFEVQVAIISITSQHRGWYVARGGVSPTGSPAAPTILGSLIEEYEYSIAGMSVSVDVIGGDRLRVQVTAPVGQDLRAVATIRYTQSSNGTP